MMKEFVMAALPWVIMGLCLAFWAVKAAKKKEDGNEEQKTYISEGMAIGMLFGVAIGTSLKQIGTGISLGMLVGMVIGMNCPKKKDGDGKK